MRRDLLHAIELRLDRLDMFLFRHQVVVVHLHSLQCRGQRVVWRMVWSEVQRQTECEAKGGAKQRAKQRAVRWGGAIGRGWCGGDRGW